MATPGARATSRRAPTTGTGAPAGGRLLRRPFSQLGEAAPAVASAPPSRGAARLDEAIPGEASLSAPSCCGARRWPSAPKRHIPVSPSGSVRSYVRPQRGVPLYPLLERLNNMTRILLFHHGCPLLIEAASLARPGPLVEGLGGHAFNVGLKRRRAHLTDGGCTRLETGRPS
jgi:hypothetical protein